MNKKRSFVVGDLMQEIQEQDLMVPVGGAVDGGGNRVQSVLTVISAITAITGLTAWSNDKATRKFKCGEVLTLSAECNGGTAC
ncbi:plantaricin C family lantibiotic [Aristaeella hokkaidonensis]|uniref:Plantaricin C family lantibiotic n=1 Tax=Aristaeella hokkaidonensis TaxID=3046382 RepID=A0AC61N5P5_9FIRM|nr:plantaricin C family lantibiotic [Aristaeella hokkaidonensis]QTE69793.1 plantaricin C family lantibiotic [Clostridiales bacterium FE2011]QUC66619.1 plantaricin C family lantibiotic [Aristaeella hokkaidonensis]SNT95210.1 hypothetical protein SAMN06297421_11078 [Aristaeella hokkaidonensis]